jgi:hypothetical protein
MAGLCFDISCLKIFRSFKSEFLHCPTSSRPSGLVYKTHCLLFIYSATVFHISPSNDPNSITVDVKKKGFGNLLKYSTVILVGAVP